jgi:hypothetical protein
MPSPSFNNYIEDFSHYISSGDSAGLEAYLTDSANPAFLKIYRNGAIKACMDVLIANFPSLNLYLGKEVFKQLGRQYILQHWPQDSRLSTYGEDLAEFIGSVADEYLIYGSDLAKLDRAWLDALFASNEPSLSSADIAGLVSQDEASDSRTVRLASSVRLIRLDYQCLQSWIGLKFEKDDLIDEQSSKVIMMWRLEQSVHYRQLDEFEESFINAIFQTGSIMIAAETAIAANPSRDISTLFAGLLSAGILAKI